MTEAAVLAVAVVLVLLGRKLTLWWCDLFLGCKPPIYGGIMRDI